LVIVHPWEAGTDDSPRFDAWVGSTSWQRRRWTKADRRLLDSWVFSTAGVAIDNRVFAVAWAIFTAIAADAAIGLAHLTADSAWRARGVSLAETLDSRAWDGERGLWSDVVYTGSESSSRVPTSDAVLPALCVANDEHATIALRQLTDPAFFGAPFGPRFTPCDQPAYRPDAYWRGPAWPQLNYLLVLAARHRGMTALADEVSDSTKRAVLRSGFAEYWNPETGDGLGATPQTWAAVAAAL
jgi:glycogen debranching enzyme